MSGEWDDLARYAEAATGDEWALIDEKGLRLIAERDVLAARLAAVEAFLDETDRRRSEEWGLPLYGNTKVLTGEVRAVLSAAPTNTTKETDR